MENLTISEFIPWVLFILSFLGNLFFYMNTKKEIFKKIYVDTLTKVYNRKLITFIKELIDMGNKYTIVFADIDHFKLVNDKHGHDIGDEVLIKYGEILKRNFSNQEDYVLRWGGEEFLIFIKIRDSKDLLNEDYEKKIINKINKLKETISETKISGINITSSFGVSFHEEDKSLNERIKEADSYLYYSKENGRNRVSNKYNSKIKKGKQ